MPTRWINQSQPQSLVNATFLLYMNAVFGVIFMQPFWYLKLVGAAGAWGMANEKKWGYILSAVVAIVPLTFTVLALATNRLSTFNFSGILISLIFQILLVALLFHPASRSYQRIWFK